MTVRHRGRPSRLVLLAATMLAGVPLGAMQAALAQTAQNPVPVPSGQSITPTAARNSVFLSLNPGLASHPGYLAGQAISTVVSPDKRTLLVLTSGYNSIQTATGALDAQASSEYVFVYDISAHAPVQKQVLQIPTAYAGIAFSPDGQRFYVGSGGGDSVYTFALAGGAWAQAGAPVALGHAGGNGNRQGPSTAGLAVTADGARLAVANIYNDSLSVIDLASGKVTGELDLRPGVEQASQSGVPGGETPFWVAIKGNATAYVSSQRDREIDVVDIGGATPALSARIPVKGTPTKILLNRAGSRLFVAADNDDTVQVVDTRSNQVVASIAVALPDGLMQPAERYRGASPNALALSADERVLYVSNGGENAVAVVHLDAAGHPLTTALLPTGWYPNAVSVANGWLYAANGKSNPGPNPGNCQGYVSASKPTPAYAASCQPNQYILQLESAGLLAEPIPAASEQNALSVQVGVNDGYLAQPNPHDAAVMAALRQRIKHVIYIVKENRTYDQILGDLGRGNGDPSLVEFGQAVTPNFHSMASQFVDLDNFYDSGEVSGNGWPWSTSARETDFNVKTIPLNYSSRPTNAPYDAEGQNRGVDLGLPTVAARQAADPNYPGDPNLLPGTNNDDAPDGPGDDGADGAKQGGYLWDSALKAGLSVRNYGFLEDLNRYGAKPSNYGKPDPQVPEDRLPFLDGLQVGYPVNPALIPLTDPYFRGFDNQMPDFWRAAEWGREFLGFVQNNNLPSLTLLRLMHDHMGNFSTAIDGVSTPETQQADNDLSVGLVAQAVAASPYKDSTLIFVVEDDAQDGPDHVDAHRSTAYVVGPYVKQGAVVSTRYSTVNMLRTIEDVLGIDHLNINDAYQPPMTDVFDLSQASWSFHATPSSYLYGTSLPLTVLHAENAHVPQPTHDAAWWTRQTRGYDWTHEDRVPSQLFNQVVWRGLHPNRPYPTVRSGLSLRGGTAQAGSPARAAR